MGGKRLDKCVSRAGVGHDIDAKTMLLGSLGGLRTNAGNHC